MATHTVAAVYGVRAGQERVQRLGSGILPSRELVVVDPVLAKQLASGTPPRVVRVGLGSVGAEEAMFVELREVARVLESVPTKHGRIWALELAEPARSPVLFGIDGPPAPAGHQFDADELAEILRSHSALSRPELPPPPPLGRPHPKPPHGHPAWLWCRLFPNASFCPHRG